MLSNLIVVVVAVLTIYRIATTQSSLSSFTPETSQIHRGQKLNRAILGGHHGERLLILGIQTQCGYCIASLDFYRKLILANESLGRPFRIVALIPGNIEESRRWVQENKLSIVDISSVTLSEIGIDGTPTIVLVDQESIVSRVWIGRLTPTKEIEVLAALKES